ncbi:MAG TPA: hemerythrin family protein [Desulfuromonadales bacterium]|jgi:hemerythrin-like metal-binding protein
MSLRWTESLAVGHPSIDDQHRELIDRFRDLLLACKAGKGKEKVAELFGFLDAYVTSHFSAEEKLMAEQGYPGLLEHKSQHAWLAAKLAELKGTLLADGPTFHLVVEANQTLLNWIVEHIRSTDVRFGKYLQGRN